MAASDARPFPLKNTAYRMPVSFRKTDGTIITSWAGMDTQVSLDGANYAAATNEATEIQTSGTGYVDLTAAEMNADMVWVKITVTNTDALPLAVALGPQEVADLAQTADAIWDEALAGHVSAGSTGEALSAAGSAGDPWITPLPGAYGAGTAGNILGNPLAVASLAANSVTASALAADAVAEIADGVWDEALAGHLAAGSTGEALDAAGTAGDPWTTALPGAYGAGTAGKILGDTGTNVTAIKAKTDNLPASPAAVGSAMTLTSGERDAIATALLDLADGIETDWTLRQTLRVMASGIAGVNSGNETNTPNYRNLPNTKGRISATLDDSQNRTAVTYDPD